jgi:hypothetical protein
MTNRPMIILLLLVSVVLSCKPASADTIADRGLKKLEQAKPLSPEVFEFVVVADTRSLAVDKQSETFHTLIPEMNTLRPSFVVDVGDIILGGAAEYVPAQWDEFERVSAPLQVPLIPVTGNHDISDAATEKIWLDRVGPLTFTWTYGNSLFVALNSEEIGALDRIPDTQVEWLKSELAKSKSKHIFMFVHKPYFANDWDKNWGNVAEAIKGYPVRVVFGGDNHLYRYVGKKEGVDYVISAGGGAELRVPEEEGGFHHYCIVRVRGDDVSWVVVKPGSILPADVVTQDRITEVREARTQSVVMDEFEVYPGEEFSKDVVVTIKNPHAANFDSELQWKLPSGWNVEPTSMKYTAPAKGEAAMRFAISAATPTDVKFPVPELITQYKAAEHGGPIDVIKRINVVPTYKISKAMKAPEIDGKLEDWSGAQDIPLPYGWAFDAKNTDDLKANIRLAWDKDNLYLAGIVEDDEFHQPYAGDIVWSADGLQLFIGGRWEWGLTLTKAGTEVFLYKGVDVEAEVVNQDVKLAIAQDGRTTTYEAAFPLALLRPLKLKAGEKIPFSICANDFDPSHADRPRHWAELTPGVGDAVPGSPMARLVLAE